MLIPPITTKLPVTLKVVGPDIFIVAADSIVTAQ